MKNRYALIGSLCLLLALVFAFLTKPASGSALSLMLYLVLPLAALSLSLISVRRREKPIYSMGLLVVSFLYLGLLVLGFFSFFDTDVLAPSQCSSSQPLRCIETEVGTQGGLYVSFNFENTQEESIDLRSPVIVASIDGLSEPGVCSVAPELVVTSGEKFAVNCLFGDVTPPSSALSGRFGLNFADNQGELVQVIGTYRTKISRP